MLAISLKKNLIIKKSHFQIWAISLEVTTNFKNNFRFLTRIISYRLNLMKYPVSNLIVIKSKRQDKIRKGRLCLEYIQQGHHQRIYNWWHQRRWINVTQPTTHQLLLEKTCRSNWWVAGPEINIMGKAKKTLKHSGLK